MMKASACRLAFVLAALAFPATANSAIFIYLGTLTGAQEIPPNASPGVGQAKVVYDNTANTLRVQVSFSGLLGNTTASHIHVALAPGTNGGVATTTPTFAGFPIGVTSGVYDRTLDLTLASSYNPAFVTANGGTTAGAQAALAAGLAGNRSYLNVHTNLFPGGEIRANLTAAVPEPASWAMMLGGFGLLGAAMRRRRAEVAFA